VYSENHMETLSEIGEKAERIGISGPVFTLGTVNSACSVVFYARISGIRANPLKYTDPDGKYDLSVQEKEFGAKNPISFFATGLNARTAYAMEKIYYGGNTWGTKGDAFRHSLWSALNAQTNGITKAFEYGDAHEQSFGWKDAEVRADVFMDIHNNAVGVEVGEQYPNASPENLSRIIKDKIEKGDMVMLKIYRDTSGGIHNDAKLYRSNDRGFSSPLDFDDPSLKRSGIAQKIYNEM
jgi:hypothetical protein